MSHKNRCYSLISNEVYLFSQTLSYILILPKLFYLQTSVKSQRSYVGRQASCCILLCAITGTYKFMKHEELMIYFGYD